MTSVPDAERPRALELDGIRGLAIALVLVWHYFTLMVRAPEGSWLRLAKAATQLTWSGVDLFFVLSGFLLGGILLENRESPSYFKAFYLRRVFRILPVYILLMISFAVLNGLSQGRRNAGIRHMIDRPMPLWSYLTFTQNFTMASEGHVGAPALSVTWSLAVEEQFYLFLPLLIRFVPLRWLRTVLALLVLAAPVFRLLLWSEAMPDPRIAGFMMAPARGDSLLLGALLALAVRHPGFAKAFTRYRTAIGCVFLVLLAGMVGMAIWPRPLIDIVIHVAGHFWIALFYGTLILWVAARPSSALGAVMRFPALRALGLVSYAVYLFHMPVLGSVFAWYRRRPPSLRGTGDVMLIVASLGITLTLAMLSWYFLEKPLLRIGHRFKYWNGLGPRRGDSRPEGLGVLRRA
jgi:peptidoglycan/LPS O-acetylase OafA/YrhL